ncbi:SPASM domain-containing protein [Sinorhizobium meliloti]|nr:SPASM domain-containing protein [Sinorhizobium meliloti]
MGQSPRLAPVSRHQGRRFQRRSNLHAKELADYQADLDQICADLLVDLEQGRTPIEYQPITKIVRRLMLPEPITRFCGVAGSYLGVASSGDIYPCFRHLGLEHFHFGNVRTGVSDAKRREFLGSQAADVDSRPICEGCWARYLCGGGCYADSTVYGADVLKPQVEHCPFWRAEIETAIRFYEMLRRTDPTWCLLLFGDDPDSILASAAEIKFSFAERRNCQ